MIMFDDGPAQTNRYHVSDTAPIMVRAVCQADGTWVPLIDDAENIADRVVAYMMHGRPSVAFVDGRDPKTGKRWGRQDVSAHYRLLPEQPADEHMRTRAAWVAWCEAHKDDIMRMYEETKR